MLSGIIQIFLVTLRCFILNKEKTTGTPEEYTPGSLRTIGVNNFSQRIAADINRTVSRRSKLKSRMVLVDEQSNPSNLLQHEDTMFQHRGADLSFQYGL